MSDAQDYDGKNLDALRQDLKELQSRAREEGVVTGDGPKQRTSASSRSAAQRFATIRRDTIDRADGGDKGRQLASRMLKLLQRGPNDKSSNVPGTQFTEHGVQQMMEQMSEAQRGRRASSPPLQKLHTFLTAPTEGRTIAGASVERIRMLANLLPQVEKNGWDQVRTNLAKRKEDRAAEPAAGAPPAAVPQKRRSTRSAAQ